MKNILLMIVLVLCCGSTAQAQWQNGNLALRTNGSVFQTGDQLRVELIALDDLTEPFTAQVVYAWKEEVEEKDDEGKIKKDSAGKPQMMTVERTRQRDKSPVFERFNQYQTLMLDDRYHFGDNSPTGWYEVRVAVFQGITGRAVATLRSLIYHQNSDTFDVASAPLGLFLRGLKRVNHRSFWTFDGAFNGSGDYEILLLRGGKVVRHLKGAGYTSGKDEFNLSASELDGLGGQTFDVLVHDRLRSYTSCLTKITVPNAN